MKLMLTCIACIGTTACSVSSPTPSSVSTAVSGSGSPISSGGTSQEPIVPVSTPTSAPSNPQPATSPLPPSVTLDSEESAFVTLINNYRLQNGAPALVVSLALTESSRWMSEDMANNNYLSHTDSLGRDPFTRMSAFNYITSMYEGENIAAGNETGADTFAQWQSSPPHNANMLDANYLVLGVGRAYNASSDYGWYWTTDFGSTIEATIASDSYSNSGATLPTSEPVAPAPSTK